MWINQTCTETNDQTQIILLLLAPDMRAIHHFRKCAPSLWALNYFILYYITVYSRINNRDDILQFIQGSKAMIHGSRDWSGGSLCVYTRPDPAHKVLGFKWQKKSHKVLGFKSNDKKIRTWPKWVNLRNFDNFRPGFTCFDQSKVQI